MAEFPTETIDKIIGSIHNIMLKTIEKKGQSITYSVDSILYSPLFIIFLLVMCVLLGITTTTITTKFYFLFSAVNSFKFALSQFLDYRLCHRCITNASPTCHMKF